MLKSLFLTVINRYSEKNNFNEAAWSNIEEKYTQPDRHYHNLNHLKHIISELAPIKSEISNWDGLMFSVFYHDIIYDVKRTDNEIQSAKYAEKVLRQTSFTPIETCIAQINATQKHQYSTQPDTNYFIDADLTILGQPEATYQTYIQAIRNEYGIYTNDQYRQGRIKALAHFLDTSSIYKTDFFKSKYEAIARHNLNAELTALKSNQSI